MGMTLEKRRSTIQPHSFCSVLAAFISSFLCLNGHAYDPIALPPSTAPPAALETQPIPEEAQTLAATAKETCVDIASPSARMPESSISPWKKPRVCLHCQRFVSVEPALCW